MESTRLAVPSRARNFPQACNVRTLGGAMPPAKVSRFVIGRCCEARSASRGRWTPTSGLSLPWPTTSTWSRGSLRTRSQENQFLSRRILPFPEQRNNSPSGRFSHQRVWRKSSSYRADCVPGCCVPKNQVWLVVVAVVVVTVVVEWSGSMPTRHSWLGWWLWRWWCWSPARV